MARKSNGSRAVVLASVATIVLGVTNTASAGQRAADEAAINAESAAGHAQKPAQAGTAHRGLTVRADPAGLFQRARNLEAAEPMSRVLGLYLAAAQAGYGPAQKRLGNIYGGEGDVARDYPKAIYWQKMARQSGESVELPRRYQSFADLR